MWLALLLGAWGAALGMAGAFTGRDDLSQSGERGVHAATAFSLLSGVGLGWALVTGDLTYRYVASWASYATPLPYRIGAVWAGPSGALLLWAVALGTGAMLAAASVARGSSLRTWTSALLAVLLVAVLAMACFDTSPFTRLPFPPDDGRGLPLEWMRPIVLMQLPVGYIALALLAIPSVMTVMGALGTAPWRDAARRWALVCWALLGAAMLLDWRRRYGDGGWADDWRWAPLHSGSALGWAGAALLAVAVGRRWRSEVPIAAGFIAFILGLAGITMRRAGGWDGVHQLALSSVGHAAAWIILALVVVAAATGLRAGALRAGGWSAKATVITPIAVLVASAALVAAGFARASDIALTEGARANVPDRFGAPWTMSLEGVSRVGREDVVSDVVAVRAAVNGRARAFVTAEVRTRFAGSQQEPVDQLAVSGIASGMAQDLRIDVRETNTSDAVISVRFVPAVAWLWLAGLVAVIAACVSAFAVRADAASDVAPSETVAEEGT